jgi:outer membrane lipoprotein-sorting protein
MSMSKVVLGAIIGLAVGVGCSSSASQSGETANFEENTQKDKIDLVQKYPGKEILECITPTNEYKVYTGETGFVTDWSQHGTYKISTANYEILYPAHLCVYYKPKR